MAAAMNNRLKVVALGLQCVLEVLSMALRLRTMITRFRAGKYYAPLFLSLSVASATDAASVDGYVSELVVRYPDGVIKIFVQGPDASKESCESYARTTWENIAKVCGTCWVQERHCRTMDNIGDLYATTLRGEPANYPYVVATPKGRIIIRGTPDSVAAGECAYLAQVFRANGYPASRCVLP